MALTKASAAAKAAAVKSRAAPPSAATPVRKATLKKGSERNEPKKSEAKKPEKKSEKSTHPLAKSFARGVVGSSLGPKPKPDAADADDASPTATLDSTRAAVKAAASAEAVVETAAADSNQTPADYENEGMISGIRDSELATSTMAESLEHEEPKHDSTFSGQEIEQAEPEPVPVMSSEVSAQVSDPGYELPECPVLQGQIEGKEECASPLETIGTDLAETADLHVAGSSCTDHSPRGLRNRENGKCFIAFLAWNIFTHLFSAPALFQRDGDDCELDANFDAFFCATDFDLYQELQWATNRPESMARAQTGGCAFSDFETFQQAMKEYPLEILKEFCRSLTKTERRALIVSKERKSGLIYQLNQNPDFSESVSTEETMGTVIRNAGILWSRWMMMKKPAELEKAQEVLYGNRSLEERFGSLSGRELQDKIFATYGVLWLFLAY
eukprot:Skav218192  [mRNA]  locus=scaffold4385:118698:123928:+ [translate_table: standard]